MVTMTRDLKPSKEPGGIPLLQTPSGSLVSSWLGMEVEQMFRQLQELESLMEPDDKEEMAYFSVV